jgi:hypothetical protein
MKTIKRKSVAAALAAALLLSASLASARPQDRETAPKIPPPRSLTFPNGFQEGTGFIIDPKDIQEERTFIDASFVTIKTLLRDLPGWRYSEARKNLVDGIQEIVNASGGDKVETLMRISLNRALFVTDTLDRYSTPYAPGVVDGQVRMLWRSLLYARDYARFDHALLDSLLAKTPAQDPLPYAEYGLEYATFISALMDSIVPVRAQFIVAFATVGWLHEDIKMDPLKAALGETELTLSRTQKSQMPLFKAVQDPLDQTPARVYIAAVKSLRKGLETALEAARKVPRKSRTAGRVLYE